MIDSIYDLADNISKGTPNVDQYSEYYRCILYAIYYRTGKKSRHEFTGVVTNIKHDYTHKLTKVYLMNVYWSQVYVTHHVVIHLEYKQYEDELNKGDFIYFSALINEYKNGDNFGLTDFQLIDNWEFEDVDLRSLHFIGGKYYGKLIRETDFGKIMNALHDNYYKFKNDLYHKNYEEIRANNRLNKYVPFDCYNSMIHSIYYRQTRECDLFNKILNVVPYNDDLKYLIEVQLFVLYLTEVKKIKHPGYVLSAITKFVLENSRFEVPFIAERTNTKYDKLRSFEDMILQPLTRNGDTIFYYSIHIDELSDYVIESGIFNGIDIEIY